MFNELTLETFFHNKFVMFIWWVIILLLAGIIIGRFIMKIQNTIIKVYENSSEDSKRTITLTQAATWVGQAAVWICIFVLVGNKIGIPAQVLTLFSTVFGAGLGFGMQSLFKDVISSVVNISERLMNVGDFISIESSSGSYNGTITKVTLRHIQLSSETDGTIIIPQGSINIIKNYSEGLGRFVLDLYFDTDIILSDILDKLNDFVDKVNRNIDLSEIGDEEDLKNIIPVYKLTLRGISDVAQGSITIQLIGETAPGEQFIAKRTILKMITNMLYNDGIIYHGNRMQIIDK